MLFSVAVVVAFLCFCVSIFGFAFFVLCFVSVFPRFCVCVAVFPCFCVLAFFAAAFCFCVFRSRVVFCVAFLCFAFCFCVFVSLAFVAVSYWGWTLFVRALEILLLPRNRP